MMFVRNCVSFAPPGVMSASDSLRWLLLPNFSACGGFTYDWLSATSCTSDWIGACGPSRA